MSVSASAAVMDSVPFRAPPAAPPQEQVGRFLLLESKSLPRSGLHYMKSLFARALGECFSFCEWYYEPDCCRKMPCAAGSGSCSGAQGREAVRQTGVRLTKSHDFELLDPLSAPAQGMMRIILVRDPLYALTSWYTLECISRYDRRLVERGIDARKIWYLHDRKLVADAFAAVDDCFEDPAVEDLKEWLTRQSAYIAAFLEKWALPAVERPVRGVELVSYEEIDAFVGRLLADNGIGATAANSPANAVFRPRISPYSAPSPRVGDYLARNARLFERYASRIRAVDRRMMIPALHGSPAD